MRIRNYRTWLPALPVLAALALTGCGITDDSGRPLTTLAPKGERAQWIHDLSVPVFLVAGVIFVLVEALVIVMAVRFRRRKNEQIGELDPVQTHGNTPLEIGWTVLPALILAVLAFFNVRTIIKMDDVDEERVVSYQEQPVQITVVGHQWWWEYQYDLDGDDQPEFITATQAVIPVDTQVPIRIQSNDVIHSFWIPGLNGKKDAVPGRTHGLVLHSNMEGIFEGQCTEYCGLSHGVMRMQVKAVSPAEFDEWIAAMSAPPIQPETDAEKAGQAIFVGQCARCHQINGLDTRSEAGDDGVYPLDFGDRAEGTPNPEYNELVENSLTAGNAPNLTKMMRRDTFAGSLRTLYQDVRDVTATGAEDGDGDGVPGTANILNESPVNTVALKEWLRNPLDVKPMAPEHNRGMPNLNLSEEQIDQLVAYLTKLK